MNIVLKVQLLLLLATLVSAQDSTVSNLQPCDLADCRYRWNLYTLITAQRTLEFKEANATALIWDARYSFSCFLHSKDPWTIPPLHYEPPETLPEDSYCLQVIGGDRSISCQNPAELESIRPTGTYCFDTKATANYYPYIFDETEVIFFFKLNFTVQLDSGPFLLTFDCNSLSHECTNLEGNGSMPYFEFWPMFDAWITFTQTAPSLLTGKYLFVPTSPLFPFTPLPPGTILVDSNIQYPTVATIPDCYTPIGAHAWQNTTNHLLNPGFVLELSDYGLNISTATLNYAAPSTILRLGMEGFVGSTALVELTMYIPERDFEP